MGQGNTSRSCCAVPESPTSHLLVLQAHSLAVSCCSVARAQGKQVGAEHGLEAEGMCWPTGACCPPFSIVSAIRGRGLRGWMWRCRRGCVDASQG